MTPEQEKEFDRKFCNPLGNILSWNSPVYEVKTFISKLLQDQQEGFKEMVELLGSDERFGEEYARGYDTAKCVLLAQIHHSSLPHHEDKEQQKR